MSIDPVNLIRFEIFSFFIHDFLRNVSLGPINWIRSFRNLNFSIPFFNYFPRRNVSIVNSIRSPASKFSSVQSHNFSYFLLKFPFPPFSANFQSPISPQGNFLSTLDLLYKFNSINPPVEKNTLPPLPFKNFQRFLFSTPLLFFEKKRAFKIHHSS